MSQNAPATVIKKFDFDPKILGPGSSASVEIGAATSADVLAALGTFKPFPDREITLGSVEAKVDSGGGLKFKAGHLDATARVSAGVSFGLCVIDAGTKVVEQLGLEDASRINLEIPDTAGVRYLVLRAGYNIEGSVSATHPIGLLGSATFGVEAARSRLLAVVSRFKKDALAADALSSCVKSLRLPRQIDSLDDLAPGTMLVSEADGSIAFHVAATLGYDFSFVREAAAIGLTGDIGLKIETGLNAAFGFEASGRYLIVIDRASLNPATSTVKLDLFKLNKKGWNFGLSLSAKVQGNVDILPTQVDDLVKAVFGIHGAQIIKDLRAVEKKWLNKDVDLSDTIAGLANKTGLELLEKTTGIDPQAEFDKATAKLMGALKIWDELPQNVSSRLWDLIGRGVSKEQRDQIEAAVRALASGSEDERRRLVAGLVGKAGIEDSTLSQLIAAIGSQGLLALFDRPQEVEDIAGKALAILDGSEIANLQKFVDERLDLTKVLDIAGKADFDKLDAWLVNRLSQFLDDRFSFEKLDSMKNAIGAVVAKRQLIYAKARQALERQYNFNFAYAYRKDTERTALVSATFDLTNPDAADLLQTVVKGNMDALIASSTAGVTLHKGVLTHSITRASSVDVNFPFYSSHTDTLNTSLARVTASEDSGRVLLYDLDSSDEKTVRNRFKSQLAIGAGLRLATTGNVRTHSLTSAKWSYQFRSARENIRRPELERQLLPFVNTYFGDHFEAGGHGSLSTWLADFDRQVETVIGRPTEDFGDLLLSMEVTLPAAVLAAWLEKRSETETRHATMDVSRALQRSLRDLLPFYYFQELSHLNATQEACAAMMVWASLPISTQIRLAGNTVEINTDLSNPDEKRVYWDWRDLDKRQRMMEFRDNGLRLSLLMAAAEQRLLQAGRRGDAALFTVNQGNVSKLVMASNFNERDALLGGLLRLESTIAEGAAAALRDIQSFHDSAATLPSKAIERLAEFGSEVARTFHDRIASVYGDDSLRSLGSMVFIEASRALREGALDAKPSAMLSLTVLKEERTFSLPKFLKGESPEATDIAVAQRLVAAAS